MSKGEDIKRRSRSVRMLGGRLLKKRSVRSKSDHVRGLGSLERVLVIAYAWQGSVWRRSRHLDSETELGFLLRV